MSALQRDLILIVVLAGVLGAAGPAFAGVQGRWAPRYVEDEPVSETVTLIHDSTMKEGESVISVANDNPAPAEASAGQTSEIISETKEESTPAKVIAEIPPAVNENEVGDGRTDVDAESHARRVRDALDPGVSPSPEASEDAVLKSSEALAQEDRRDDDGTATSATDKTVISSTGDQAANTDEEEPVVISSADAPGANARAPEIQPEKAKKEASPEPSKPPKPQRQGGNVVVENGQNGETVNVGVVSWRDLPFKTVLRQAYDFSCGSAAVATLMTYAYGLPVREIDVFRDMFVNGDQAKIRREGFSMLDMSNYLNANGLEAKGYKIAADAIAGYRVPFIALINTHGYNHFVVVKSMGNGRVLVGDPNTGNADYSNDAFSKIWNGLALVVVNNASRSRQAFANPDEWRFARSHVNPRDSNDLSTAAASLPSFNWQIGQITPEVLPAAMANISSATGGKL